MNQLYILNLNHFSLLDKSAHLIFRKISVLNHSFHALVKHKDVTLISFNNIDFVDIIIILRDITFFNNIYNKIKS